MMRGLWTMLGMVLFPMVLLGQPAEPEADKARPPALKTSETSLVRSLLKLQGIEPITELSTQFQEWSQIIVVVFGTDSNRQRLGVRSPAFATKAILNNGGAVWIASDQPYSLQNYLPTGPALTITGAEIFADATNPAHCHTGLSEFPYLFHSQNVWPNPHLIQMTNLPRVATNRPSTFSDGNALRQVATVIATAPPGSIGSGRLIPRTPPLALLLKPEAAGKDATGVLYSDVGLFTNQMLTHPDTDNLQYTFHLIQMLAEG
ncbi:MAG: hypothetical protein ACRCZF_25605, partial [Gemmataceae bacterium]